VNPRERERRFSRLKAMSCLACWLDRMARPCGPTEIHHLNEGGKAGQKRRGDEFTIPLGPWHHRGQPPGTLKARDMALMFGPSLARQSRAFRERYGSDDELLRLTDRRVDALSEAERVG
jgi:hypothetical protein